MMVKQDMADFNRKAAECSNHRMIMTSSERCLVNPRYDNGGEGQDNVLEYRASFKCLGSCEQISTFTSKPTKS